MAGTELLVVATEVADRNLSITELESGNVVGALLQTPALMLGIEFPDPWVHYFYPVLGWGLTRSQREHISSRGPLRGPQGPVRGPLVLENQSQNAQNAPLRSPGTLSEPAGPVLPLILLPLKSSGTYQGYGLVAYGMATFQSPKNIFTGRNFQFSQISGSGI